ncbi:hypothetical protein LTR17_004960 [Elasticomyces elasticus]|nr:hypothetical protein LTR17_004960 [Elasticomyces elasticus]
MFDKKNSIEVLVKLSDSADALDEIKAKSTHAFYANGQNKCYIEAAAGKQYEVEVTLHPGFKWKKARKVQVNYKIDLVEEGLIIKRPTEKDEAATSTFSEFTKYVDGVATRCAFVFGQVETRDDLACIDVDQQNLEIEKRGLIEVTVERVSGTIDRKGTRELNKPVARAGKGKLETLPLPDFTNKLVSRDNGRSHYTQ